MYQDVVCSYQFPFEESSISIRFAMAEAVGGWGEREIG